MASKFDVAEFRQELADLDAYARVELQKAESRKGRVDFFIKKVKECSKICHEKLKSSEESICMEFIDKIAEDGRTPYEKLSGIKERNKEFLSFLKELLKKTDRCFYRVDEKKEVSYTERNLVESNRRKMNKLSNQILKDDTFLDLFEQDVMGVCDKVLVGLE